MYLKRRLNRELTLLKGGHFPFTAAFDSLHRYEVVVGIGGNLGDVKRRFEHLFYEIKRERRVDLLRSSLILKNPPFGFLEQDDFFNSILVLKTSMQPKFFLEYLMRVEKKFGRRRSFANAPRTLDLDIIFFDNRFIESEKLHIPHPAWHKRESVVIPLSSLQR